MRRVLTAIATAAGVYGVLVLVLFTAQRQMIYVPDRSTPAPAEWSVPDMAPVTIATADGLELTAWHKPPAAPDRPTLLWLHGNGGHLGYRGPKYRPWLDDGYGVLAMSWRGYGGNPGKPTEDGLYADGRAALDWLAGQGAGKVVLYGESLGSGIATKLAAERAEAGEPVAAVILESPFTSVWATASYHYPFVPARWLVRDRFDSLQRVAEIGAPLLVVHGEADRIVPVEMGRTLFEAAVEPKQGDFIDRAGHNDLADFGLFRRGADFLARHID